MLRIAGRLSPSEVRMSVARNQTTPPAAALSFLPTRMSYSNAVTPYLLSGCRVRGRGGPGAAPAKDGRAARGVTRCRRVCAPSPAREWRGAPPRTGVCYRRLPPAGRMGVEQHEQEQRPDRG